MVVVVDRQATLPPAAASWPATASPAALPAPTGDADGLRDGGYGRFRDASGVAACAAVAGTAACRERERFYVKANKLPAQPKLTTRTGFIAAPETIVKKQLNNPTLLNAS